MLRKFSLIARQVMLRFGTDRRGNIMMTLGLALPLLMLAIGFGIDYGRAEKLQTRLNAAADAAALVAVDPAMLCQSSDTAKAAATAMFQSQAASLSGIASFVSTYNPQVNVTPANSAAGCTGTLRTATVTWKANAQNIFSSILGVSTLPIGGTATANAAQPPSINFYVMLDTSPSMLLPSTSAGITNMLASTNWVAQGKGCTFACHSNDMQQWRNGMFVLDGSLRFEQSRLPIYLNDATNPAANLTFFRVSCISPYNVYDANGNLLGSNGSVGTSRTGCQGKNTNPSNPPLNSSLTLTYTPTSSSATTSVAVSYPDSYWLAENYGSVNPGQSAIQLRIDAETLAAQNLITYAYNVEQQYASSSNPPIYKLQYFTFNVFNPSVISTSTPFNAMTDVATLRSSSSSLPGLINPPLMYQNGFWLTSSQNTGNFDTDANGLTTWLQSSTNTNKLPTSTGLGTQASPQSVLVIVTDGMDDAPSGGNKGQWSDTTIAQCTNIKKYTRIAILYTTYDPATINYSTDSTFNGYATNNVPNILSKLQSCASKNPDGTYLLVQVSTDGNISQALNQLFNNAIQTARLVQ
jgi:Flp pilus assembly protein TadG